MSVLEPELTPPPNPYADARFRNLAFLSWLCFGIGLFSAWATGPVGWIIALLKQGEATGTIYQSHFAAIVRGGIICFLGYAFGTILVFTFIGAVIGVPVLIATWIYNVYIVVRGLMRLSEGRRYD